MERQRHMLVFISVILFFHLYSLSKDCRHECISNYEIIYHIHSIYFVCTFDHFPTIHLKVNLLTTLLSRHNLVIKALTKRVRVVVRSTHKNVPVNSRMLISCDLVLQLSSSVLCNRYFVLRLYMFILISK